MGLLVLYNLFCKLLNFVAMTLVWGIIFVDVNKACKDCV